MIDLNLSLMALQIFATNMLILLLIFIVFGLSALALGLITVGIVKAYEAVKKQLHKQKRNNKKIKKINKLS